MINPHESAVERSLPWKQNAAPLQSNNNISDNSIDENSEDDDDISQLPFFSPFLHQWPKHLNPDYTPSSNHSIDPRTQSHSSFLSSFPNLHLNDNSSSSIVHKVSSLNDMQNISLQTNNVIIGIGNNNNSSLHTGGADSLYGVAEQSICSTSSHLPWRDMLSEEPMRCNESRNTCITSSDIESHHRQCVTCFQQACDGHDPAVSFDGGSRRRSHISIANLHHTQQDFPHHAISHLPVCHGDSIIITSEKRAHNLLNEPHIGSDLHELSDKASQHYFTCLEERVQQWFNSMQPCDYNESQELLHDKIFTVYQSDDSDNDEQQQHGENGCVNNNGGGDDEDEDDDDDDNEDDMDLGSDAREFAKIQRAKNLPFCDVDNNDDGDEDSSNQLDKPQSFIDYTAQNQLTLRAKPGVSLF